MLFPGLAGIVVRLELYPKVRGVTVDGMIWPATEFTVMANSDVDGGYRRTYRQEGNGYPSDLRDAE